VLSQSHWGAKKMTIVAIAQIVPASQGAQTIRRGLDSVSGAGSRNMMATGRK